MTLDQVFMLLCDRKFLRGNASDRVVEYKTEEAGNLIDEQGFLSGVDGKGRPIKARILGKTKVERLREKMQEDLEESTASKQVQKKKRNRNGD